MIQNIIGTEFSAWFWFSLEQNLMASYYIATEDMSTEWTCQPNKWQPFCELAWNCAPDSY